VLSSKDFLEAEFEDLRDIEFRSSLVSKQVKQIKANRPPLYKKKKHRKENPLKKID
jgi:hypothetical protein